MLKVFQVLFLILLNFFALDRKTHSFLPWGPGQAHTQPITVQIDPKFSIEQQTLLQTAFTAWETASQNRVQFQLHWNSPRPSYSNLEKLKYQQGIYLWYIDRSEDLFGENQLQYLLYNGVMIFGPDANSSNIVIFKTLYPRDFYLTALHEIGHLVGLLHSNLEGTVMYTSASSTCITEVDATALCQLYNCQPKPECYLESNYQWNPFNSPGSRFLGNY